LGSLELRTAAVVVLTSCGSLGPTSFMKRRVLADAVQRHLVLLPPSPKTAPSKPQKASVSVSSSAQLFSDPFCLRYSSYLRVCERDVEKSKAAVS